MLSCLSQLCLSSSQKWLVFNVGCGVARCLTWDALTRWQVEDEEGNDATLAFDWTTPCAAHDIIDFVFSEVLRPQGDELRDGEFSVC